MNILLTVNIGLITGSIMYYVTKLFFDPIVRYKEAIYEIDKNLIYYANAKYYKNDGFGGLDKTDSEHNQQMEKGKDVHRISAGHLRAAYCHLPRIYKKILTCSGVNPFAASRELIGLSNTTKSPKDERYDPETRIRKHLRLFHPETGKQMSFAEEQE